MAKFKRNLIKVVALLGAASFASAFEPSEYVPKKLSICPSAIIIAMPDVKPVITGEGIYETSLSARKTANTKSITPEIRPAVRTPLIP